MNDAVKTMQYPAGRLVNYNVDDAGRTMLSSTDNLRNTGCYPANPDTFLPSRLPEKFTGKERDIEIGLDYPGFGIRNNSY